MIPIFLLLIGWNRFSEFLKTEVAAQLVFFLASWATTLMNALQFLWTEVAWQSLNPVFD
jgi:hypothetical protein